MMPADLVDLERSEELCMEVRRGDLSGPAPVIESFSGARKGALAFFRREKRIDADIGSLLAVSEALEIMGMYMESLRPIEMLLESDRAGPDIKKVALARAGQLALLHGLPVDLGPMISELGLSRKDLRSALRSFRRKRERKKALPELESHLFHAMLLDDRADQVESASLGADHVKAAFDGLQRALSISSELERDIGEYHRARCMYHLGSFMLKRGEVQQGGEVIDIALKKAVEGRFEPLLMNIRKIKGLHAGATKEAVEVLDQAMEIAEKLHNDLEASEISFIIGNRKASDQEGEAGPEEGISTMLLSASKVEGLGHHELGASYRAEAALWSARLGDPEKGVENARAAFRTFKRSGDRESMIRAGCILFLCYIRMNDRTRAKKLLLDLITEHPVKQYPSSFSILKEAVSEVGWLREDRDTAELFEEERIYTIERSAVEEMIMRAKDAYPNEFGAMLRGFPHITHIDPVMEGASNRSSFLFSLYSRFSQRNVEGEGVVHSHPSGSARPSGADLSMFGRFPGINIIIGYPFSIDSMAAYDRLGNRVKLEVMNGGRKQ
ncbi:MAG: Mov34/MPN/PAD-1 family protein [Candidatus Thermoplasmatota archaeon]|nr:Mov34/MPN/PAD-1 family protein [Candidatus Thermoplasmatota archaeon]